MSYSPKSASSRDLGAVVNRHAAMLMAIPGVEGVAVGEGQAGHPAINVYVRDASVKKRLPSQIEGHPVSVVVTGGITAY